MNKREAIEKVSNNGWDLDGLSDELEKDKDVVLAATANEPGAIEYADESLRGDKDLALPLMIEMPNLVQHVGGTLKKDKKFSLTILKESQSDMVNYALEHADKSLKSNPELTAQAEAHLVSQRQ